MLAEYPWCNGAFLAGWNDFVVLSPVNADVETLPDGRGADDRKEPTRIRVNGSRETERDREQGWSCGP